MVGGLKRSVPIVVKAVSETSVSGNFIAENLMDIISKLARIGFNVRGTVCDDHSSNVNAYSKLSKSYGKDGTYFIHHPSYEGMLKTYLLFDSVHLIKNIRNNLLCRKKLVFPTFEFNNLTGLLLHSVYEKDQNLEAHLKKAHTLTYRATHPGDNKQSVPLALAIFDETTYAAIRSYFPNRKDAAAFLHLISVWWSISNSKVRYNTNNYLGNGITMSGGKLEFLLKLADWVEEWSKSPMFTFTSQTTKALMTTLIRATAALAYDLLNESYEYVLTSKFQSDFLERRYGNLRSMSAGRFLVSLTEVNNSQRILLLTSVIKEDINFWEHDLYANKDLTESWQHFKKDISIFASKMHESCLLADSLKVSATVSGYIAKKINEKVQCDGCTLHLISTDNAENINNEYLLLISRGSLYQQTLWLISLSMPSLHYPYLKRQYRNIHSSLPEMLQRMS